MSTACDILKQSEQTTVNTILWEIKLLSLWKIETGFYVKLTSYVSIIWSSRHQTRESSLQPILITTALKWKVVFTFLNVWGKSKRRIIHETQMSVSINKDSFEHGHTHLFTIYGHFHAAMTELSRFKKDHIWHSAWHTISWR
jgi:hypothetical protein